MKKIRLLFIVLLLFLLCGCSGNYNLTFNEDLSLKEELDIEIKNDENAYENTLSVFENANIDKDKYEVYVDEGMVKIKYNEEYDSLEEYVLYSNLYHVLFDDIEYSKDSIGMKLGVENYFKLDDNGSNEVVNSYDIDNLKINIKVPFYVNKSNEDSKNGDVLTWELNKKDTYKDISMDFSYKKASTLSIILIILLGGSALVFIVFIVLNLLKSNKL